MTQYVTTKNIDIETKSKLSKAIVRLTTKYTVEATNMRVLHRITGKTLLEKQESGNLRRIYIWENINKWLLGRKRNRTSTSVEWITEE